jgi:arylsulfatase A-like enzyme
MGHHRRLGRRALALGVALLALGCEGEPAPVAEAPAPAPNLLLIVADDVGTDRVAIYGEAEDPGRTPNLDRLGREGLVFERFWSMPSCSVTRAALLSGRYPHRTGVGAAVRPDPGAASGPVGLSTDVEILPRALAPAGYASALLGKWHLGTRAQGFDHPLRMGFDHHRGSFGNLGLPGGRPAYDHWNKLVDGVLETRRVYATTDTVDEAIALSDALEEPWLLVVSFNAAHKPLHVPPPELHGYTELSNARRQPSLAFRAMVEAMDTEIGRLLAAVEEDAPFVFFLGDNGTDDSAYPRGERRRGRIKGSLYEGGVRVPFIVSHPSIPEPGRRVDALAGVTDLFATLVELAGADRRETGMPPDSVSLVPLLRSAQAPPPRGWILAESFFPNGAGPYRRKARAVRDERFKLIRFRGGVEHFHDLAADPGEETPLETDALTGEAAEAFRRLSALADAPPPVSGARLEGTGATPARPGERVSPSPGAG